MRYELIHTVIISVCLSAFHIIHISPTYLFISPYFSLLSPSSKDEESKYDKKDDKKREIDRGETRREEERKERMRENGNKRWKILNEEWDNDDNREEDERDR